MTKQIFALSLLGVLALPFSSFAATYHYIDIYGVVRDVEATTTVQALSIVDSLSTTIHTGVADDTGLLDSGDVYGYDYTYVNTQGNLVTIHAASLDAARILATDRAENSGFLVE